MKIERNESSSWVPPAPVRGFRPAGVLRERMLLNFDRMDSTRFAPVEQTGCLQRPDYAWPGDMEGRWTLTVETAPAEPVTVHL